MCVPKLLKIIKTDVICTLSVCMYIYIYIYINVCRSDDGVVEAQDRVGAAHPAVGAHGLAGVCRCVYIYIYIERERGIYTYIHTYIHIYIDVCINVR